MSVAARSAEPDFAEFELHRRLLFGVAYRMLGSAADAEDVVQDTWLRWADAARDEISNARSWLVTVATRLAIDRLRSARVRREQYVGPWLPEPILTRPPGSADSGDSADPGDPAAHVERTETVSLALLTVLESLSPLERAVFVLREAFGFSHAELAEILGRSEPAVRQLAARARAHVRARARRYDVDARTREQVTRRFVQACLTGDTDALLAVLAPDVELVSDAGGQARAPRRVITGAGKVARFLLAVAARPPAAAGIDLATVNGEPAIVLSSAGAPAYVIALEPAGGRVAAIWLIANPAKLAAVRAAVGSAPWPEGAWT